MSPTGALGWALLHFVWQGAVVAGALAFLLRRSHGLAATARYALCVTALGILAALPVATAVCVHRAAGAAVHGAERIPDARSVGEVGASRVAARPQDSPRSGATSDEARPRPVHPGRGSNPGGVVEIPARLRAVLHAAGRAVDAAIPWIVRAWLAGVLFLSIKLLGGWMQARRLGQRATRPAPDACRAHVERLAARLSVVRPVRLLESAAVQVPAVLGWLRPVILVPASAVSGLTPQQLEVLLAHELAHVRRHDYLVNLLQSALETLLFYHPAVWWVSGRIRQEREHCCDDIAVSACGDVRVYAGALLDLERMRAVPARLAAAAGGSPLRQRIQRLLAPRPAHAEALPRWIPAALGLVAALSSAGAARLWSAPASGPVASALPPSEDQVDEEQAAGAGATAVPRTLVRHPDPTAPLRQRSDWAHGEAKQRGWRAYWVGHTIRPLPGVNGSIYFGRLENGAITGHGISLQGRLWNFGGFEGFRMPGERLPQDLGASDDVALLFAFESSARGPVLRQVHVSSLALPVDLEGEPLLWLGPSDDGASVELVQRLCSNNSDPELAADLVAVTGVHSSSALVVPILTAWLGGSGSADVRKEAAEWLGRHPDPRALQALARAARGDRSPDVRREAAESVGEMSLAEAGDSAIALAHTLRDRDARREAVESLGERGDDASLKALVEIARHDPDRDIEREAVETLGHRVGKEGVRYVEEIARTHPDPDVRREAVETLGETLPPAEAERLLVDLLHRDESQDVQREVVETLGQSLPAGRAVERLREVLRRGPGPDAQREAVETLAQMDDPRGIEAAIEAARSHPDPEVRRAAAEAVGQSASPEKATAVLGELARKDDSEDVQRAALEALADVENGAGIPVLVELARSHPDPELRRHALQVLVDSPDPRARELFQRALERP